MTKLLGAVARMARPANAIMAAAGVATGASLLAGALAHWDSVALAMAAAMAGLGAGNILNDLHDVQIDRRAHPQRPLVTGEISARSAAMACGVLFALAILAGFASNLLVGMLASVLVVWLIVYEVAFKARGLLGNIWVSMVVAATFAIGAAAAALAPLTYDRQSLALALQHPRLAVPLVLSVLAFLANLGREIFKDVEDAPSDAGWRRTLPLHMGWRRAMNVGRLALAAAIGYALLSVLQHVRLGAVIWLDLALLAPALTVFVVAIGQSGAHAAQLWTKRGMLLALAGLFAMGMF